MTDLLKVICSEVQNFTCCETNYLSHMLLSLGYDWN